MRALSLRAPWWYAVLHWGKDVENRAWRHVPHAAHGPLLLHASAWWQGELVTSLVSALSLAGLRKAGAVPYQAIRDRSGGIVGRVHVVGVQRNGEPGARPSHWAEPGLVGLLLADPTEAPVWVPWPGQLGFFRVDTGAYNEACVFARESPSALREDFRRFWPRGRGAA